MAWVRLAGVGLCFRSAIRGGSQGDAGRRRRNGDAHRQRTRRDSAGGVRRGGIVRRPPALVRRDHAKRRASPFVRDSGSLVVRRAAVPGALLAGASRGANRAAERRASGRRRVARRCAPHARGAVELRRTRSGTRYPLITLELTASRVTRRAATRARERATQLLGRLARAIRRGRGMGALWRRGNERASRGRWATSGVDVTFASGDQRIAAAWSVDEQTGLPGDDLHISIDPIDKAAGGDDASVAAAVEGGRELSEAVISFLGRDGAAGIVVWLKRASLGGIQRARDDALRRARGGPSVARDAAARDHGHRVRTHRRVSVNERTCHFHMPTTRPLAVLAVAGLLSTNALAQGDPKMHAGSLSIKPDVHHGKEIPAGRTDRGIHHGADRVGRSPRRRRAHEPGGLHRRGEAARERATPRRRARYAISRRDPRRDRLLRTRGPWARRQGDRTHGWNRSVSRGHQHVRRPG